MMNFTSLEYMNPTFLGGFEGRAST